MKTKVSLLGAVGLALLIASVALAGPVYPNPVFTSYQIANLGSGAADITVTYYDGSGATNVSQNRTFSSVPAGGSVTVLQSTESTLGAGTWSAVVSSNQPIAAVVNQQLGTDGSSSSIPPFSSYSGASQGATTVVVPVMMENWFGYNTQLYIQNVGSGPADISIAYAPTTLAGSCVTGATGQTDSTTDLAQYASILFNQETKTALGASGLTGGCATFNGRFLGSATITSDQPIVAVVNEAVQGKLFTYNGFNSGGTTLFAPAYMRDYFGFYAAVVVSNPSISQAANITMTYTSDASFSNPTGVVTANHTVPAGKSITIYDGPGSTAPDSDLAATYNTPGTERFFGSLKIASNIPVMAIVNQESTAAAGNKGGSYNAMGASESGSKLSVPLIQSAFYGFYTSLTIQSTTSAEATVNICYTSDGTYSSVLNHSKCYSMTTTGGFLNRYEGAGATAAQSDLLDDAEWLSGGNRRFIGSATIEVTSGPAIVAFVNSEASGQTNDAQYSYNAFVITP
jgi:hypothetical protein